MKVLAVFSFIFANFVLILAESAMEKEKVVPDVIDKSPAGTLEVLYSTGVKVDDGNTLTPTKVKDEPSVTWSSEEGSYHLLVMVDPDVPSRKEPEFREANHWLVGNIPGNDLKKGEVLAEYIGSGPPQGTGLHRYVFLVYKQAGKLTFDEDRLTNTSAKNRAKFSAKTFAKKYKLGEPVAGNFFQAEYDDYVPILRKQLED